MGIEVIRTMDHERWNAEYESGGWRVKQTNMMMENHGHGSQMYFEPPRNKK